MPYFVFRVDNHREYHCLGNFDTYREARDNVRARRRGQESTTIVDYRMIFAQSEVEGESLLRTRRERTPSEDD